MVDCCYKINWNTFVIRIPSSERCTYCTLCLWSFRAPTIYRLCNERYGIMKHPRYRFTIAMFIITYHNLKHKVNFIFESDLCIYYNILQGRIQEFLSGKVNCLFLRHVLQQDVYRIVCAYKIHQGAGVYWIGHDTYSWVRDNILSHINTSRLRAVPK